MNKLLELSDDEDAEKAKEYQILNAQREIEYFKILQDEEAYQRLLTIKNDE